jgi:putative SbcD/Mre11-related phosphoesterase
MRVHRDWLLTHERAAVHLPTATLVLADLHLGYAEARRRGGEAVPVPDLGEVLRPLASVRAREGVRRVVIAGDLFEAGWSETLAQGLLAWLDANDLKLLALVPGNHDRRGAPARLLPLCAEGVELGGWRVLHGDTALPAGRVVHGHFHPWLRWREASAACFLVGDERIVLPAFSRDARGVNVLGQERWRGYRCCAIVGYEVLDLGLVEAICLSRARSAAE